MCSNNDLNYVRECVPQGSYSSNHANDSQQLLHCFSSNVSDHNYSNGVNLRKTDELPEQYRTIFSNFQYFNVIQSQVLDTVLYTDDSVVVSAPTGSGKTVIFELAIINFLSRLSTFGQQMPYKIVYVAPLKALCEERLVDWYQKFASLGLSCISVTGDTDHFDFQKLLIHNFIITTPEKWDSLTRRWRDNKNFISLIKLFMIDEIHLLNDDHRGPTVEVVLSRMKAIHNALLDKDHGFESMNLRFIAASATIPNIEDIAEWLNMPSVNAKFFKFGEEMRPVKLKKIVLSYKYNPNESTPFKFDFMLNYKLQSILLQHAEGKPTLIFCSTRKNVEMTSRHLTKNLTINLSPQHKAILHSACTNISESKIKEVLLHGVGYHHAGLLPEDRKIVEDLFRNSNLPILVTTSTLAMGINLPAHLVIIKSTKHYSNGGYQDYSESTMLQMIGRAGRPQFDTSATAVILTTNSDKAKYENLVGGVQAVESSLHKHLTEHVNAEVVLGTITDLAIAMEWLTLTFLYVRARKNPKHYGLPSELTLHQIDKKLLDMCQIEINRLARAGMLTIDANDVLIIPTPIGSAMAKYYVAFDTMKLFTEVSGKEIFQQILTLISKCKEFSDILLRVNDKKTLNLLNVGRGRQTIRFPLNGKINTVEMKINCLIQAVFGCLPILEPSLINESEKIMRIGERISNCLAEYLSTKHNCYSALLSAFILTKCFHAHLWEDSPYVSRQLSGIGNAFSTALVEADKANFQAILDANPRDLERIINRKPPMGNTIQEQVQHLPQYQLQLTEVSSEQSLSVNLKIHLQNSNLLQQRSSVDVNSEMTLLVGDSNNDIILLENFKHSEFIRTPELIKNFDLSKTYDQEIHAHFISANWVGIDCQTSLVPSSVKQNGKIVKSNEHSVMSNDYTVTPKGDAVGSNSGANSRNSLKDKQQQKKKKMTNGRKHSHIQMMVDTYFKKSKILDKKHKKEIQSTVQRSGNKENKVDAINISSKYEEKTKLDVNNGGFSNTNTLPSLQNIISESIKECADIFQIPTQYDTQKGYHIPTDFLATVRPVRHSTGRDKEYNSAFNISQTTNKHRLKDNMNCSFKFDAEEESKNMMVRFKYQPRKTLCDSNINCKVGTSFNPENQEYHISEMNTHDDSSESSTDEYNMANLPLNFPSQQFETNPNNVSKNDNQKTISWRSPLISSPLAKYSPGLEKKRKKRESNVNRDGGHQSIANLSLGISIKNDSSESMISSSPLLSDSGSSVSQPNGQRPTLKDNCRRKFHNTVSDKGHMQYGNKKDHSTDEGSESNITQDYVSSSILEELENIKQSDNLSTPQRNKHNKIKEMATVKSYGTVCDYFSKSFANSNQNAKSLDGTQKDDSKHKTNKVNVETQTLDLPAESGDQNSFISMPQELKSSPKTHRAKEQNLELNDTFNDTSNQILNLFQRHELSNQSKPSNFEVAQNPNFLHNNMSNYPEDIYGVQDPFMCQLMPSAHKLLINNQTALEIPKQNRMSFADHHSNFEHDRYIPTRGNGRKRLGRYLYRSQPVMQRHIHTGRLSQDRHLNNMQRQHTDFVFSSQLPFQLPMGSNENRLKRSRILPLPKSNMQQISEHRSNQYFDPYEYYSPNLQQHNVLPSNNLNLIPLGRNEDAFRNSIPLPARKRSFEQTPNYLQEPYETRSGFHSYMDYGLPAENQTNVTNFNHTHAMSNYAANPAIFEQYTDINDMQRNPNDTLAAFGDPGYESEEEYLEN